MRMVVGTAAAVLAFAACAGATKPGGIFEPIHHGWAVTGDEATDRVDPPLVPINPAPAPSPMPPLSHPNAPLLAVGTSHLPQQVEQALDLVRPEPPMASFWVDNDGNIGFKPDLVRVIGHVGEMGMPAELEAPERCRASVARNALVTSKEINNSTTTTLAVECGTGGTCPTGTLLWTYICSQQ